MARLHALDDELEASLPEAAWLRVRTHDGALTRFFLDALLGLTALRCHAAERAVRREHEMLLVEWARASGLVRTAWNATVAGSTWAACSSSIRSGPIARSPGPRPTLPRQAMTARGGHGVSQSR